MKTLNLWMLFVALAMGGYVTVARAGDESIFDMSKPGDVQGPTTAASHAPAAPATMPSVATKPPVSAATLQPTPMAATTMPASQPVESAAAKSPVPSSTELRKAKHALAETYPDTATANTPLARVKSARTLMAVADADSIHPAEQYALLTMARDLFAEATDAREAAVAVTAIGRRFKVHIVRMQCDAAEAAGRAAHQMWASNVDRQCAAPALIAAADGAVAAGHFDWAAPLDEQARSLADDSGDRSLREEIAAHERERSQARSAWEQAKQARETLHAHPHDKAALLAEGRFQCLVAGDWERGLPELAKGSDAALAAAATAELAGDTVTAADGWWDDAHTRAASAREHSLLHLHLLDHAADLYADVQSSATGLARQRIN